MTTEKAKEGEIIAADNNSVRLMEALSEIAKPFAQSQTEVAKTNADMQVQMQRETTKQLDMRLTSTGKVERRAAWQEFTIVTFVLISFGVCLGFGLLRDNMTLVGIGVSGMVSFVGGLGLGRARKQAL